MSAPDAVSVAQLIAGDGVLDLASRYRFHRMEAAAGTDWPMTWVEAQPPAGGETCPWSALHVLRVGDDPAGDDVLVLVPYASWGDYSGGIVERANGDYLREHYGDELISIYGDYGSEALALPVAGTVSDALADELARLVDYPCLDDERMSELELQLSKEAWESYGPWDMRRELSREHGVSDDALDALGDDALRKLWYDACESVGFWPYAESATTVILWDRAVVAAVAERVA